MLFLILLISGGLFLICWQEREECEKREQRTGVPNYDGGVYEILGFISLVIFLLALINLFI